MNHQKKDTVDDLSRLCKKRNYNDLASQSSDQESLKVPKLVHEFGPNLNAIPIRSSIIPSELDLRAED